MSKSTTTTLDAATKQRIAELLLGTATTLSQVAAELCGTATTAPAQAKSGKRGRKVGTKATVTPIRPVAAEHGVEIVASRAAGEKLAANGADPDSIMVPAGRFGRDGHQTLTQARAKATESAAKREAYLAERGTKAAEPADGVSKEQRQAVNKAMSEHLRSMGVVPTGLAWTAAKNGERSAKKLLALNVADGIEPKGKPVADRQKAKKAKAASVAVVTVELDADKAAKVEKLVESGFARKDAVEIVSKLA